MRKIAVVTVARSDYGILLPVLRAISAADELDLQLIVSGMHLEPAYGLTVRMIESDGWSIAARVEMQQTSDEAPAIARSMGLGTIGFSDAYARLRPDLLVLLGDRFEMHAAASAAVPFNLPIAHLHGGELSEGAIDDVFRHSITKMSHLHFVSTEPYGRRVVQMGEAPWRVTLSGAPGLDNFRTTTLLDRDELAARFGVSLPDRFLLVTFHPTTLEPGSAEKQCRELLAALDDSGCAVLFTMANADTGGMVINRLIREHAAERPAWQFVENLGTQGYASVMALAAAMVGNSSSGIIEAASFRLPVVNVGTRQRGRVHGANVIDTDTGRAAILDGIRTALSNEFRVSLSQLENPYGDGHATPRIVERLRTQPLGAELLVKKFHNLS